VVETSNHKIVLIATLNNFENFMAFIDDKLRNVETDESDKTKILMVCEEIIINIINHAYQKSNGNLEICFVCNSQVVKITFVDSGIPFNPLEKADTDINTPLEKREAGGLGILMIKKLMDEVHYKFDNSMNYLTIIKYLKKITTITE
jgi:serine/threonine-protein kinase RsbW